jgi:arylsulfatase
VPPKGAPNVLLIITDDAGYGVASTFGGVIPTPALERIASAGLRYTQFHSTALCSPTRAALITGRNHHSAGFGVVAEQATGFPGYDSVITRDKATIGKILKDNGYATSWFGKNHNTPSYHYTAAGPFDQWPIGMGFDYFYGFMGGDTSQWQPMLYRNTTLEYPWVGTPGYNLTTDMADEAIEHLRQLDAAAPDKPFFIYYAPGGTHAPHHPTPEWVEKISDMHLFDRGWNELRETIFANQKKLGVIPASAQLTEWPDDLAKWDTLSDEEKKLFIRQADVFAAYVAYTDHEIGRVIQQVEDMGKLDNTLIIYIEGDNGTSPEGTPIGTPAELTTGQGIPISVADMMKLYDAWGTDQAFPHMAVGWAWAFDTPFQWTKQIASHFGGTRQGMAISWPARIKDGRRNPPPVPPRHRHRADAARGRGNSGAEDRGRHPAGADRGRQHGLHLRQGERCRAEQAQDAVLRDVRQPRHLPRRLVRGHDAARPALEHGARQDAADRSVQLGAVPPDRGLLTGQRPRGEESR